MRHSRCISGSLAMRGGLPSAALLKRELESASDMRQIGFEARALTSWDSSVLAFLVEVSDYSAGAASIWIVQSCLPGCA
jgi:hypothetical protein